MAVKCFRSYVKRIIIANIIEGNFVSYYLRKETKVDMVSISKILEELIKRSES